jgi:multisubunit Na+/H+ antiporter MnhG subunit
MDETGRLIEAGAHARPARPPARPVDPLRRMGTKDLVTEVARKASALARKEVELAKAELRTDLRNQVKMAGGLGAAGLCAIWGVELLLVAVVLGLMEGGVLPGWAAALVVAAVVFAIGAAVGLWGWSRRVRKPLDTTRRSVQDNVRWAKERIA